MGRDQVQKKKGQGSGGVRKTTALEAKTKKGKRYLEQKAPQVVEYVKRLLLLYGHKTSQTVKDVMVELKHLRDRAECRHLTRKNDNILPFENGGETSLEFLCNKQDCGAFVVGSSTKKRPNNLIFGRVYDEKVYDLLEVGIDRYVKDVSSAEDDDTQGKQNASTMVFSPKPSFAFAGEEFNTVEEFKQFKSILIDSFRGRVVDTINLKGVDRVILCTPSMDKQNQVLLRHYAIKLKRSGTRIPKVELVEIGPRLDLSFRRSRPALFDVQKEAVKKVDEGIKRKKVKNVSDDILDGTVGRIWVKPQDIDSVPLKKPKGKKMRPVE